MPKNIRTIIIYVAFAILMAVVYGYAAFTAIFMNLADGSMLHAYLWNIIFIIILLVYDKIAQTRMQSPKFVITKRNYFIALWMHIENYISFKTTLYIFYIFILIASRVTTIDPTLVSEDFRNFVLSIEYGLILVIAFDKLVEHLFKDLKRAKTVSDKFKEYDKKKKK